MVSLRIPPLTSYICLYNCNIPSDVKVFFDVDTYEVPETSGSVELCVRRTGDTSNSLTIQISTVSQEAEGMYLCFGREMYERVCYLQVEVTIKCFRSL